MAQLIALLLWVASLQAEHHEPATPVPPAATIEAIAQSSELIYGHATYYGVSYQGQPLGCGDGLYDTNDPTIAAVSPARYAEWPCGTRLRVCGPGGCAVVIRRDACPGCYANLVDLSESANRLVCGVPEHTCEVTIERLTP